MASQWIGIQFNFDLIVPQQDQYNRAFAQWVREQEVPDTTADNYAYLQVKFTPDELHHRTGNFQQKVNLLWAAIDKYLEASTYTNLQTWVTLPTTTTITRRKLYTAFERPIRRDKNLIEDNFIRNFTEAPAIVLSTISKNPYLPIVDALYKLLQQRDFATSQWLTLHLELEAGDELNPDQIEVSVQLEILGA